MDVRKLYEAHVITGCVKEIEPLVIERGEGAELITADGRRFLDAFAGISVTNCGHANPEIIAAARAQLDKFLHCCGYLYYSPPMAALAAKLTRIAPRGLEKSFFANSGAEAVEGALRLAKRRTGKREFIALEGAFHGRTYAALSLSGLSGRKRGGAPYMPGAAFAPAPYCYRCAYNLRPENCGLRCAEALNETFRYHTADDVAALLIEPVLGEGGIIVPPRGYLSRVAAIAREHGALLIVDEVQTGFGRTGKMFACEHEGIEPDILALAKAIANGLPLGAFVTRAAIAAAFQPGDHLSTFGGNPVACAAGLATIEYLEKHDLPAAAARKGKWLMGELGKLKSRFPQIGDVRGLGLMIGVEIVQRGANAPDPEGAAAIRRRCRESGMLLGLGGIFGNVIRIQPPLIISEDQLARIVATLESILGE